MIRKLTDTARARWGRCGNLNGGWQLEDSCGRSRRQITSYYQAAHPAVSLNDDVSSVPWSHRKHRSDEGGVKRPTFKVDWRQLFRWHGLLVGDKITVPWPPTHSAKLPILGPGALMWTTCAHLTLFRRTCFEISC